MTYAETIDFLYSQVPMFQNLGAGAYKPGLDTTLALAKYWHNPHKKLRAAVHVGGTNGKGSTAHTLAAILQSAGYKTGLYTSPHLIDFRERIRVNGTPIAEKYVTDFVEEYLAQENLIELHPTFFELTTIMALNYFVECDVDVAIIEVGLGGRLDCTNIIMPCLSIITNISLDHTALLGNTEPEIAHEKAGIIKSGVPIVIGNAHGAVRDVFERKATETNSEIIYASDSPLYSSASVVGNYITYTRTPWGDIQGELTGDCQIENTATILAALKFLERKFEKITKAAVLNGFKNVCELTGFMGRWMVISEGPIKIICDTGHNIGGWILLGAKLKEIASKSQLHMVLGFVNDKDINAIMEQMPTGASYYFASPSVKRGRIAGETALLGAAHNLKGRAFDSVKDAYNAAMNDAKIGDTIFIGGSTFVVADFLSTISLKK
ncbi:MAG: bifunctional folylpolyglutamate synthase/dihydrofolate synthase [Muribaculaceae bacterium]|nr:bifunctional folylpolyglutamate synthase/dihydrofolate synthase [Muribaculaceae bacterium]